MQITEKKKRLWVQAASGQAKGRVKRAGISCLKEIIFGSLCSTRLEDGEGGAGAAGVRRMQEDEAPHGHMDGPVHPQL